MSLSPFDNNPFVPSVPALFCNAPSVKVVNVKQSDEVVLSVPPDNVNTSLKLVPEPESTEIEFPAVPAVDADKCNAVVPSTAVTPIAAVLISATKLSNVIAVVEPVAK